MREDIIIKFFMSLEKQYPYAIIHHAEYIFEETRDIDFAVNCGKGDLHLFISNFCSSNSLHYVRHTIDLGTERYNLICFGDTKMDKIELDITYSNHNILEIDVEKVLNSTDKFSINGKSFNTIGNEDEFLIYLKKKAFKKSNINDHVHYLQELMPNVDQRKIHGHYENYVRYFKSLSFLSKFYYQKFFLFFHRALEKPSETICFLGPDGSGKTTIIEGVRNNNPFVNFEYYHLKPKRIKPQNSGMVTNPHQQDNYSIILSILKLVYLVFEYNLNWLKHITPNKIKPVLIVFDRYFDDIYADPQRYRYGASGVFVKMMRKFIPQPNTTFVLVAPKEIIFNRKKEVTKENLSLQLERYKVLGQRKNNFIIDVDRPVYEIVKDVVSIMLKKRGNG